MWIARDMDGQLHLFVYRPCRHYYRKEGKFKWESDGQSMDVDRNSFNEITWESEPVEVKLISMDRPKRDDESIIELISDKVIFCTKEVLTSDETARYLGISKSYLYKLTMFHKIPHFKPMGKMCYFNRKEIEQWAQSNRITMEED